MKVMVHKMAGYILIEQEVGKLFWEQTHNGVWGHYVGTSGEATARGFESRNGSGCLFSGGSADADSTDNIVSNIIKFPAREKGYY